MAMVFQDVIMVIYIIQFRNNLRLPPETSFDNFDCHNVNVRFEEGIREFKCNLEEGFLIMVIYI